MSSIPKSKRSTVKSLLVEPDDWNHYPTIEYSTITNGFFTNLSGATRIERSTLRDVSISSKPNTDGKSNIERSTLADCEIVDCRIERSELKKSTVTEARVDRSPLHFVKLVGPKLSVERSQLDQCEVTGKGSVDRSQVKDSLCEKVTVNRSVIRGSYITNSSLGHATVTDCDVADCKISSTSFVGKVLRNGVWSGNDLVGRIDDSKEVVCRPKGELPPEAEVGWPSTPKASTAPLLQQQPQPQQATGTLPSAPHRRPAPSLQQPPAYSPRSGGNAPETLLIDIQQNPIPARDYKERMAEEESGMSAGFAPDSYEGPRVETPPRYEPSTGGDRDYDIKG